MNEPNRPTQHVSNLLSQWMPGETSNTEEALDTRGPIRMGYRVLGIGLGIFLLWAAFAPLDEGVPAPATVMLDTKRKSVQHQYGGVVEAVLVKEGQNVHQGAPLLRLDDKEAKANYATIKQHYLATRAQENRLMAEQEGRSKIVFHPDLLQAESDPVVAQHMETQRNLLKTRQKALQAELQASEEGIQGQTAVLAGLKDMLPHKQTQIRLLREDIKGIRDLVQEGYAPRVRLSELERQQAELSVGLADLQSNIGKTTNAIAELKMRAQQRRQEYLKEVDSQLADVRKEVEADAEKLNAATAVLERTLLKAPATGQVMGLAAQTIGGVIQPYQTLMDIVPEDEALLLEIHIPPHLIDRVNAEERVDVRFASFAHTPQLVVEGKLISISGDLISDPRGQQPAYYLARAALTPEGMKTLGNKTMQAGMPAEVIIKTGHRSLLTYLLHPLLKRVAASLTEE